jgi:signal transduction histidine kinase
MRVFALYICFVLLYLQGISQINLKDSLSYYLNANLNDTTKIDKVNQLITKYAANDPVTAIHYSDSLIELSRNINDKLRLAHSISRKGVSHYFLGDYNGALDNYFLAISIKEEKGKIELLWLEYNNIGLVLRNLEQNKEALQYFSLALKGIEESKNNYFEATIWNNIGICHRGLKQYDTAKFAYEKALLIATEREQFQVMAHSLNNLGNVYRDLGFYDQSMENHRKSFEINKKLGNSYEQANILNNIALNYLNKDELGKAKKTILEAYEIINTTGYKYLLINNLTIQADIYTKMKHFENAINVLHKSIILKDSLSQVNRAMQFDQLKVIANTEKKLQEYELLKRINEIQNEKIRNAKVIQLLAGLIILIILTSLFIYIRSYRKTKQLNFTLIERSYEIESLNEELTTTNDELHAQRDNLEQALENLQKAQSQLLQSEKMASLGVLAAGIAHEINNPLNFIQGGVTALKETLKGIEKEQSAETDSFIDIIQTGVKRAAAIASSLSYYSRKENQTSEPCDLHSIIENCLLMLNHRIEGRIDVIKELTSDFFIITCNKGKLHQAILNILLNAIDAIEINGTIKVCTELIDQQLWFTLIDSGNGIPSENITKLTDPFFTTKDPDKGTGLGLAVALKTITDINGSLGFESDIGVGTKVIVRIPYSK